MDGMGWGGKGWVGARLVFLFKVRSSILLWPHILMPCCLFPAEIFNPSFTLP